MFKDGRIVIYLMVFILLMTIKICSHREKMKELDVEYVHPEKVYSLEMQNEKPWYKIF